MAVPPCPDLGDEGSQGQFWGNTLLAADGAFLLGLSIIVTILGTQMYYRLRGQPINNSVAGLVMGTGTGAIVFSPLTYDLFGNLPHRVIRLDSQVFYSLLIPPIVFYAGFSVKKKLFFKNLVTIAIFGILGCNLTAYLLSMGIYPVLQRTQIYNLSPGVKTTTGGFDVASILPTPWEASFATLPNNPTGSAHMHALSTAHHHQMTQFDSVSEHPGVSSHRRSLQSRQEAAEQSLWTNTEQNQSFQPASEQDMPESLQKTYVRPEGPDESEQNGLNGQDEMHKKLLSAALRLGTVFSPTDNLAILHYLSPNTQPVLHSLLFGEGVMNDITAVIMLNTTAVVRKVSWDAVGWSYWHFLTLFGASSVMGVSAGLLSAILTKHFFSDAHHHTDREVILMTTMAATSYVGAVLAGLSGIVAVFFCGITMSHYTWHSISASARVMSVHNFRVLCSLSEMFLFIYAGLDTTAKLSARFGRPEDAPFLWAVMELAFAMVVLVAVVRALFVGLAVAIVNLWRSYKFTLREAVIMWYGGLVRGSITTALAYSYLYTEDMNDPGDEAILLASVLVVVVSTVLVGGLSEEFMTCVTLPPAQSRLIEINLLPGMNEEDDNSVNSAAVLSSKLHKLWRRFDKAVLQRLFGGRDARMPTYFQSVAELNQRIMRVQYHHGDVPVPSMVPRHMPERYQGLSTPSSTDLSAVHTADFHGSYPHSLQSQELDPDAEGAQYLDCSGSPSPLHSSQSVSDLQAEVLRMPPPHVSSDLVSTPLSTGRVSANSSAQSFSAAPSEVTELPTTTSVIQQREGIRPMPRSHSDPHVNDPFATLPRSASANSNHRRNNSHISPAPALTPVNTLNAQAPSCAHLNPVASPAVMKKGPSGGLLGNPAGSGGERWLAQAGKPSGDSRDPHRVRIRPATPSIDGQEPPQSTSDEGNRHQGTSPRLQPISPGDSVFTQEHVSSCSPCLEPSDTAVSSLTPSPALPVSTVAQQPLATHTSTLSAATAATTGASPGAAAAAAASAGSVGHSVAPAVQEQGRVAQALRDGFLGAAGAIGTVESGDKRCSDPDVAPQQPGSARSAQQDLKPPAGPSAALAKLVRSHVQAGHGPSSVRSEGQSSERYGMGRQPSRVLGGDISTAQSMVADNLPEPYQPPGSNATSEDVHVGLENQYSSYEDALLDVTHGGEDVEIPWDAYDEEDKRCAAGCSNAMSSTYKRH